MPKKSMTEVKKKLWDHTNSAPLPGKPQKVTVLPVVEVPIADNEANWTHDRLQQECHTWHVNTYREDYYLVCANPGNSVGGFYGKHNQSIGVKKGRADYQYQKHGKIYYFEFKVGYDEQKPEQEAFEVAVTADGACYFIIRSLGSYKHMVNLIRNGK